MTKMSYEETYSRTQVAQGRKRPLSYDTYNDLEIAAKIQKTVVEMKTNNVKEKKELQVLNLKLNTLFASIINKLFAAKNHLKEISDNVLIRFNSDMIKTPCRRKPDDLKTCLGDREKALAESKSLNETFKKEVGDLRKEVHFLEGIKEKLEKDIDGFHSEIARHIADNEVWKRRAGELEKQIDEWKTRNGILKTQKAEITAKYEVEIKEKLELVNQVEVLKEKLDFNDQNYKIEIEEFQAIISKMEEAFDFPETYDFSALLEKDVADIESRYTKQIEKLKSEDVTDSSKRDLYINQMAAKLRVYETQIKNIKNSMRELESQLQVAVTETAFNTEPHQAVLEDILKELQDLRNDKHSIEITEYRDIVEEVVRRFTMKSVTIADGGYRTVSSETASPNAFTAERKLTVHGVVRIVDLAIDGKYITLEDLSEPPKGRPNMKNWTLTQTLDNGRSYTHKITDGNVFSSGKIVKIWGLKHGAGQVGVTSSSVVEWGPLTNPSTITLKDDKGEVCSSFVIKILARNV